MADSTNHDERRLMNAEDVASVLREVPVSTVYAWARTGYLPSVKIGRHRRFRPEQIAAFIDSHATS